MIPALSVIIIFLDAGRFLQEAIDSVADQDFIDWELILVDDGSTDDGTAIARAQAASSQGRIRYLEHPGHQNLGTSASRNLGLQEARGEYVLYLDADDIILPGALGRLVRLMADHPDTGIAFGSTLWWFWAPEFEAKRDHVQPYLGWSGRVLEPPAFLSAMVRTEDVHPANCSTIMRRTALNAVGGFEASFRGMYEDTVMLAKMLLSCKAFASDEVMSAYRMRPDSQCHAAIANGNYSMVGPSEARERYLRWLHRHLAEHGGGDLHLTLTLKRELWLYDRPRLHALLEGRMARALLRRLRRLLRPGPAPGPSPVAADKTMAVQVTGALRRLEAFYLRHGKPQDAAILERRRLAWAVG